MTKEFVLVKIDQANKGKTIAVSPQTYGRLAEWANISGKSICEIAEMVVHYAADHLLVVDEKP